MSAETNQTPGGTAKKKHVFPELQGLDEVSEETQKFIETLREKFNQVDRLDVRTQIIASARDAIARDLSNQVVLAPPEFPRGFDHTNCVCIDGLTFEGPKQRNEADFVPPVIEEKPPFRPVSMMYVSDLQPQKSAVPEKPKSEAKKPKDPTTVVTFSREMSPRTIPHPHEHSVEAGTYLVDGPLLIVASKEVNAEGSTLVVANTRDNVRKLAEQEYRSNRDVAAGNSIATRVFPSSHSALLRELQQQGEADLALAQ